MPSLWAFGAGLIFSQSYPPKNFTFLGLAALGVLVFLLQRENRSWPSFRIGYCFGLGQFLLNFSWIANAFAVRDGFSYVQGLASVTVLAFFMALYPALAAGLARKVTAKTGGRMCFAFLFPAAFMLAEMARGTVLTGFPWNPVGAIWGTVPLVAQASGLASVYGLSAITLLFVSCCVCAVTERKARSPFRVYAASAVLIGLSVTGYGLAALSARAVEQEGPISLRLVQANIPQQEKWDRDLLQRNFELYLSLSRAQSRVRETPAVIIWPETAYPYLIEGQKAGQRSLQSQLEPGTTLIFGANRLVPDDAQMAGKTTARNAMFVLQDSRLAARYDKVHLVPFGEYVPYGWLFKSLGMSALVQNLTAFLPGTDSPLLNVNSVPPFLGLICYEGIFPLSARAQAREAQWILNISNDAWFGLSDGPSQHFNLVRFRAIEEGIPVVRATGTGVSGVIDSFGRPTRVLGLDKRAVLDVSLPPPLKQRPLFARFGFVTSYGLLIMLVLGAFLARLLIEKLELKSL